jgi:hypothetical protein
MRVWLTTGAALLAAGCASGGDRRFHAGEGADAFVIMGVAEAFNQRDPVYRLLWRQVGPDGQFMEYDGPNAFEVQTNDDDTVRVTGLPGEFSLQRVEPGVYALDGVFAAIRENQVTYFANGVVTGPDRPSFSIDPGEAVYLGIWQMDLEGLAQPVARPWRLEASDLRMLTQRSNAVVGQVRVRATETRAVPCEPHRINSLSQREIC